MRPGERAEVEEAISSLGAATEALAAKLREALAALDVAADALAPEDAVPTADGAEVTTGRWAKFTGLPMEGATAAVHEALNRAREEVNEGRRVLAALLGDQPDDDDDGTTLGEAGARRQQKAWYDDQGQPRWSSGPGRVPRLEWPDPWERTPAGRRARRVRRKWALKAMGKTNTVEAELVTPTLTKEETNYRYSGNPARSCGVCANYIPPGACAIVIGTIRSVDVCDAFEPTDRASSAAEP